MTKKHYEKLAEILGELVKEGNSARTIARVVEWCEEDNPRFNSSTFMTAVNTNANKQTSESP